MPSKAWRTLAFAVLAALSIGFVAPAAQAAPPPTPAARLNGLRAENQQLRLVLALTGLPVGTAPDLASVRLTADGRVLHPQVSTPSSATAKSPSSRLRQAMLVLDASGSMRGSRLVAAKAAAWSYALALPTDVQVGLVSFSGQATVALAPTSDRSALSGALSRVVAAGDTALYDAVLAGLAAFGKPDPGAQRRMLLLSDGADTSSARPLAEATTALKTSGVGVDAVGIELSGDQRTVLRQLSAAGSGRLLSSSGLDKLHSAFVQAAQTFSWQVAVTADVPADLTGRRLTIVATVKAGGRQLQASGALQVPAPAPVDRTGAGAAAPLAGPTPLPRTRPPVALLVLVFLGMLALSLLMFINPKPKARPRQRLEQLDDYAWTPPVITAPVQPAEGQLATAALSVADRLIRSRGARLRLATALERAGLRIRPQEWLLLCISTGVAVIAVLTLLTGSLLIGMLLGALLSWLGTHAFLRLKTSRRCATFADQLPDVLQLIASSLRSGFSLPQAIDGVVREGPQPAAAEFARALTEGRLGVELEDALDRVAERLMCRDLGWVVMAVRISHDVGGNLAEVLLTTVQTMRQRAQLKRQIRALSAEGRISAYVLIALPIFVGAWFVLVRPQYLRPLYTTSAGVVMLAIAFGGLLIGSWWMSRIVKVEV